MKLYSCENVGGSIFQNECRKKRQRIGLGENSNIPEHKGVFEELIADNLSCRSNLTVSFEIFQIETRGQNFSSCLESLISCPYYQRRSLYDTMSDSWLLSVVSCSDQRPSDSGTLYISSQNSSQG